jgi:hypothetical protein
MHDNSPYTSVGCHGSPTTFCSIALVSLLTHFPCRGCVLEFRDLRPKTEHIKRVRTKDILIGCPMIALVTVHMRGEFHSVLIIMQVHMLVP